MDTKEKRDTTEVWKRIKKDLEIKIINGTYKSADRLPSVIELSQQCNIAGRTAQKVFASMQEDKTITKKPGVGFFVRPYTSAKLLEKHKLMVRHGLQEVVDHAKKLNMSYDEIVSMLNKVFNNESL